MVLISVSSSVESIVLLHQYFPQFVCAVPNMAVFCSSLTSLLLLLLLLLFTIIEFSSVAIVLTQVQAKQIRINMHKRNNTKTQCTQQKTQYIQVHILPKHPHNCQSAHTLKNPHITKPIHTDTHTLQNQHIHTPTHYKTQIHTHPHITNPPPHTHTHPPTHYKTYTHSNITKLTHTHTHTLQNPYISTPTHTPTHYKTHTYTYTHPHITS